MIIVDNLRVEHMQRALLDGVSLILHPGEFVGLLGPNGAGKSTLIKTMVGLLRPTSGSVVVEGKPIVAYSARQRARILSYVAQQQELLWDLPVADVVELGATSAPEAEETIRRLSLSEFAARRIKSLSGGEQARVMVARALAAKTPFLLADEPAASLDIKQQRALMRLLREEAHGRGIGIIVVLHDLNLAFSFVDRILLLSRGQLVMDAAAREGAASTVVDDVFEERFERLSVGSRMLLFPAETSG